MKKIVIFFILMLVTSVVTIGALSTKLTTVSFGMDGDIQPRYTLMGFYESGTMIYSGETYYLKLDNETFMGWFTATNGYKYYVNGTYALEGREISGTWRIGTVTGWLSGTLGI